MSRHHRILPGGNVQTALRALQDRSDAGRVAPGAFTLATRTTKQTFIKGRRRTQEAEETGSQAGNFWS